MAGRLAMAGGSLWSKGWLWIRAAIGGEGQNMGV